MTCDDVKPRLTAYLDGDLDPDDGTVVRGHLRTCDACRKISEQEAGLRDELRALPTLDPPSALWTNIQAQLAAAEIAESERPAWRRTVARWARVVATPRFAATSVLAMAATGLLWWRAHPTPEAMPVPTKLVEAPSPEIKGSAPDPRPPTGACVLTDDSLDVTADLGAEAARLTGCYAATAGELLTVAAEARAAWTDVQRASFDGRVGELRTAVDQAADERHRQRAWQALINYLQGAIVRGDVVAFANGGVP